MKRPVLFLSKGFTLLELVVVIFVIVIGIALLLPNLGRAPERSNRVKCASNLRQIGQGLMLYANDNKGAYPRTRYVPGNPLTCFTKEAATNPFADDGPDANDVTAAMFLLIRNCDLNPEVFVCPSSNQDKDTLFGTTPSKRSNFSLQPGNGNTLSYSMANMYPSAAIDEAGYRFNTSVVADFVIAADRNECRNLAAATDWQVTQALIKQMNAENHDSEGQNVMFNDGHVEWCTSPFVGANRDHIYTQQDAKGLSSGAVGNADPKVILDTVLLPYWDKKQPKPRP